MRTDTKGVKVAIMLTMAAAGLIGAIISGVVAAGSAVANTVSQAKTNEANKANVDATNAMNEQLTRESWARDDSQLQRARADAQAAGFSPLAALSNNLTNTAPATMQPYQATAPQFDSSGLISSIQEGTRAYQNGKMSDSQKGFINSQKKAQDIQNEINNATKWSQKLQNVANLAKTMKELDAQNLSNYEKASILVASGIPSSTVQKLIPYTTKDTVVKNTSQDSLIKLQTAQTGLVSEQTTTQQKEQLLLEAQKELVEAQKNHQTFDDNYWYSPLAEKGSKKTVSLPDIEHNSSNNTYKITWKNYLASNINRKQMQQALDDVMKVIDMHKGKEVLNQADWQKLGILLGAFK